jgi:hypothetical protein
MHHSVVVLNFRVVAKARNYVAPQKLVKEYPENFGMLSGSFVLLSS